MRSSTAMHSFSKSLLFCLSAAALLSSRAFAQAPTATPTPVPWHKATDKGTDVNRDVAPGVSASLSLLKPKPNDVVDANHPAHFVDAGTVVGDTVYATLNLTIGKDTIISSNSATLRVTELEDTVNHVKHIPIDDPASTTASPKPPIGQDHVDLPVDFTQATGWERYYDPDLTPEGNGPKVKDWWPAPQAPSAAATTNGPVRYRCLVPLKTTEPTSSPSNLTINDMPAPSTLQGHNGKHDLTLSSVDGESNGKLTGAVPDGNFMDTPTPDDIKADIENLVITNVSTTNGNEDYVKYDPDDLIAFPISIVRIFGTIRWRREAAAGSGRGECLWLFAHRCAEPSPGPWF